MAFARFYFYFTSSRYFSGGNTGRQNLGNAGVRRDKNKLLDSRIVELEVKKKISRNGKKWSVESGRCSVNSG